MARMTQAARTVLMGSKILISFSYSAHCKCNAHGLPQPGGSIRSGRFLDVAHMQDPTVTSTKGLNPRHISHCF